MSSILPRTLVTGASGFVGGRVVETMHLTGFSEPVAGMRSWSRAARVARFPVGVAACDILDAASVCEAMRDVQAVVHCAFMDERASIVDGTRHVLDAALRNRVQKVVFLSTTEVYDPHASGSLDETEPLAHRGDVYADSKQDAEAMCLDFCARGLPVAILRPSIVYGPYSRWWTMDLCQRLQSRKWGIFEEDGDGTANLVYVDDLVQATFLALRQQCAAGQIYNVNGPERVTWNEYFQRFNTALGLPPLQRVSVRRSRFRTACLDRVERGKQFIVDRFRDRLMPIYLRGGFVSNLMKRVKRELASTPSRRELSELFCRHAVYTDAKAREQLGYSPSYDVETGLRLSVAWLQHHGLAHPPHATGDRTPAWATARSPALSSESTG